MEVFLNAAYASGINPFAQLNCSVMQKDLDTEVFTGIKKLLLLILLTGLGFHLLLWAKHLQDCLGRWSSGKMVDLECCFLSLPPPGLFLEPFSSPSEATAQ